MSTRLQLIGALALAGLCGANTSAAGERRELERQALIAAIVEHESGGNPKAVNHMSGAIGLGQILPSTRPQCRHDPASAECATEKVRLLDPAYNLALVRRYLRTTEKVCRAKTDKQPSLSGLVMGYGGWNRPKRWCNWELRRGRWAQARVPKPVRDIMRLYRRHLSRLSLSKNTSRPRTSTKSSSAKR